MEIIRVSNEDRPEELELKLVGKLDTTTAPQLEEYLESALDKTEKLILEIGELPYISSAGLRVLLRAQERMNEQGCMIVRNPTEYASEVFEVTGFVDILTIE